MFEFTPDTFREAAVVARSYFEDSLHNIGVMNTAERLEEKTDRFRSIELSRLRHVLSHEAGGRKCHCVIACAVGFGRSTQPVLGALYETHGRIAVVNMAIEGLRRGAPGVEVKGTLAWYLDQSLAGSRLLAETFDHVHRVTIDPEATFLIVKMYGLVRKDEVPDPARDLRTNARLSALRQRYAEARSVAIRELESLAVDPIRAVDAASLMPVCDLPMWMTYENDEPGSKIINDVWLPKEYAEPLLNEAIESTAKVMSQGSGLGRR